MTDSPYSASEASAPQQQQESWWQRNWKWLLPAGCVGSVVMIAVLFIGLMSLVFSFMKTSGAYIDAVAKVKASSAVQAALGTPIEEGWFVTGNVSITGTSGDADLAIPISGPKDKGTIYVLAEKGTGEWAFSTLEVRVKGSGEKIDLLEGGQPLE